MKRSTGIMLLLILCSMLAGCEESYPREQEDNGSPAQANIFDGNTYRGEISVPGDLDYWSFTVSDTTSYNSFSLTNLTADLQLMMYVYDSSNNLVDQSMLGGRSNPLLSDNANLMNEEITILPLSNWHLLLLVQDSQETPSTEETGKYYLKFTRY